MTKAKIIVCACALLPCLAAGIYVIEGQKIIVKP